MEQFVAEPVVASRVVETDFELYPRTIEEVEPINVLLDQQRDAVGYKTFSVLASQMTIHRVPQKHRPTLWFVQ